MLRSEVMAAILIGTVCGAVLSCAPSSEELGVDMPCDAGVHPEEPASSVAVGASATDGTGAQTATTQMPTNTDFRGGDQPAEPEEPMPPEESPEDPPSEPDPVPGLERGQWLRIPNTHLSDHAPNPLPPGSGGFGIFAYSGGAFDSYRNRLIIWGGGHADYSGNELYAFDIGTLSWARLTEPGTPVFDAETTAEGTPSSRHTYDGIDYIPSIDRFISVGGSKWGQGSSTTETWTYNLVTEQWEQKASLPQGSLTHHGAYDAVTDTWYVRGGRAHVYAYDPHADVWSIVADRLWSEQEQTAEIDQLHRKFVVVGAGSFLLYDLNTWGQEEPTMQGCGPIISASAPGLAWDPTREQLVAWDGGADLYYIDLVAGECEHIIGAGDAPGGTQHTYGRFRYVPSQDAFIVVADTEDDVFFYQPE